MKRKRKKNRYSKVWVWKNGYFWKYNNTKYMLDVFNNKLQIIRRKRTYTIPLKEETKEQTKRYILTAPLNTSVRDLSGHSELLLKKWKEIVNKK